MKSELNLLISEYLMALSNCETSLSLPSMPEFNVDAYDDLYNDIINETNFEYRYTDSFIISENFLSGE